MTKKITINISDPIADAMLTGQKKRLDTLERLIKKKAKKKDVSSELRTVNKLKSLVNSKNRGVTQSISKLTKALMEKNSKPFPAMIVPSPS